MKFFIESFVCGIGKLFLACLLKHSKEKYKFNERNEDKHHFILSIIMMISIDNKLTGEIEILSRIGNLCPCSNGWH